MRSGQKYFCRPGKFDKSRRVGWIEARLLVRGKADFPSDLPSQLFLKSALLFAPSTFKYEKISPKLSAETDNFGEIFYF